MPPSYINTNIASPKTKLVYDKGLRAGGFVQIYLCEDYVMGSLDLILFFSLLCFVLNSVSCQSGVLKSTLR